MIVDVGTAKSLLRKDYHNYEEEFVDLSLLDDDELLEIDIEEDVVALYFDDNEECIEFHLDFEHLSSSKDYVSRNAELNAEIRESLFEDKNSTGKHVSYNSILIFLVVTILILAIGLTIWLR